jgi:hypothetical protein
MDEQFVINEAPPKEREWVKILNAWAPYQLGPLKVPAQTIPIYTEDTRGIVFNSKFDETVRPDTIRLIWNPQSQWDQEVFSRALEEIKAPSTTVSMQRAYRHLLLGSNGYLRPVGMPRITTRMGINTLQWPVAGLTYGLSFLAAQNFKIETIETLREKGYAVAPLGVHVLYLYPNSNKRDGNLRIAYRRRGPKNALYYGSWEAGSSAHIDWIKHDIKRPRTGRSMISPFEAARDRLGAEYQVAPDPLKPTFIGAAVDLQTKRVDLIGYVIGIEPAHGRFDPKKRPSTMQVDSSLFTPMHVAAFLSSRGKRGWVPISVVAIAEVLKHFGKFAHLEIQHAFSHHYRYGINFRPHPERCEHLGYHR